MNIIYELFNKFNPSMSSLDAKIKIYTEVLKGFNAQGTLRNLVKDESAPAKIIEQASTLLEHLDEITEAQKQAIFNQLKEMVDAAEGEIVTKMIGNLQENPSISSLLGMLTGQKKVEDPEEDPEEDPDEPVDDDPEEDEPQVTASVVSVKNDKISAVAALISSLTKGTVSPVNTNMQEVVNKISKEIKDFDFSALKSVFNIK